MQECNDEVFYFEKMEVNDFRNDVLLAEACRQDVDKFCKNTEPGMPSSALLVVSMCECITEKIRCRPQAKAVSTSACGISAIS